MKDRYLKAAAKYEIAAFEHEAAAFASDEADIKGNSELLNRKIAAALETSIEASENAYDKGRSAGRNMKKSGIPDLVQAMRRTGVTNNRAAWSYAETAADAEVGKNWSYGAQATAYLTAAGACRRAAATYRRVAAALSND